MRRTQLWKEWKEESLRDPKGRRSLTCLKNYWKTGLWDAVEIVMRRLIEVVRGPVHPEKGSGLNSKIS